MTAFLALAFCQSVELPATIRAQVGAFVLVKPVRLEGGKAVRYFTPNENLSVFPSELLTDPTATVLVASKQGRYKVFAITASGDKISSVASTIIVVGDGVDPDPLPPQPKPPQPKPDDPKPTPAPIQKEGLRVMIVYDSTKLSTMPRDQQTVLFDTGLRGLMNEICVTGEDGTKEWRIYPQVSDVTHSAAIWQEAFKRPRASVAWILISNGKTGFEGPLPGNVKDTTDLIKKYKE